MAEPFVGEVRCFGFNFAPRGWAFCDGQILPISQNDALFAIIGTIYGGNGTTDFALPNLQGRVPMHWGTSPGFNTIIGEVQGQSTVTLTTNQIPQHQHNVIAATIMQGGTDEKIASPTNTSFLGPSANADGAYITTPTNVTAAFSNKAVSANGDSQPHNNLQPYLVLNFCIALFGIFPSRN